MKKYLPFFIGFSVIFNLLFACSIFMNGFYVLKYDNPFRETSLEREGKSVEKILMINSELIESELDQRKYFLQSVLAETNPRIKKIYLSYENQIKNHFDVIITKTRSKGFVNENDFRIEMENLKHYCNIMMETYFRIVQDDIKLKDRKINKIIVDFSKTIDTSFELINIPDAFGKESLINSLLLLKLSLLDKMASFLGSRGCGWFNYTFPVISVLNNYIKVGDPVEIYLGFKSERGSFTTQRLKVKINGKKINIDKPYLLAKSAIKGTHSVNIEVETLNPITGEISKRKSEWRYNVE